MNELSEDCFLSADQFFPHYFSHCIIQMDKSRHAKLQINMCAKLSFVNEWALITDLSWLCQTSWESLRLRGESLQAWSLNCDPKMHTEIVYVPTQGPAGRKMKSWMFWMTEWPRNVLQCLLYLFTTKRHSVVSQDFHFPVTNSQYRAISNWSCLCGFCHSKPKKTLFTYYPQGPTFETPEAPQQNVSPEKAQTTALVLMSWIRGLSQQGNSQEQNKNYMNSMLASLSTSIKGVT